LRKFVWLAIALVVVVGGWSAAWLFAASEAKQQIDRFATNDGETAPRLTCETLNISGFPFRFDVDCVNATVLDQDLTVTVAGVRASVLAYNPTHLLFSAKGPAAYADAFSGSQRRVDFSGFEGSARLTAADPIAALQGEGWRIARVSVEANEVIVTDIVAGDVFEASLAHGEAHLVDLPAAFDRNAGTSGLAQYVSLAGLTLPGVTIADADMTLEAETTGLPADIRAFAHGNPIRDWQARGGVFKLVSLKGGQTNPEEAFDLNGEARLSGGGYLEGQLNYTTKGVLDRLTQLVPAMQLAMLKGAPQPDGSFTNTLTLADGQVKLLTFVFAELPPLF